MSIPCLDQLLYTWRIYQPALEGLLLLLSCKRCGLLCSCLWAADETEASGQERQTLAAQDDDAPVRNLLSSVRNLLSSVPPTISNEDKLCQRQHRTVSPSGLATVWMRLALGSACPCAGNSSGWRARKPEIVPHG